MAIGQCLNYISASDTDAARKWLSAWRSINARDRQALPIEAVCLYARVNPLELLGAILMAAKNLKMQESALKAIIAHPDVVDSTIEFAKEKGGTADRKMLHESAVIGFLPTRNGQSIAINLNGGQTEESDDDGEVIDQEDKDFTDAFPMISGKLEKWADRRRELSAGK
jgi:hypothetical protein